MAKARQADSPVIGLEDALARLFIYRSVDTEFAAEPAEGARTRWGYEPDSPRVDDVFRSLLLFGLVKMHRPHPPSRLEEGEDRRRFSVTPLGQSALPAELVREAYFWQPEPGRPGAVRRAAQRPALYRGLWARSPDESPPLCVLRDFLVEERGLTDEQAIQAAPPFRETALFVARLGG